MAFRWQIVAVTVEDAQEVGTGGWEPFTVVTDDDGQDLVLCKMMVEVDSDITPDESKRSEVIGGLGENW